MPGSKKNRNVGKKVEKKQPRNERLGTTTADDFLTSTISDPAWSRAESTAGLAELTHDLSLDDASNDVPLDPLSQAQELIYDAWECGTTRGRVALAKKALGLSALCADAWTLLAKEAVKNVVEERGYLQKAVAVGETAVREAYGRDAFEKEEGYFWGLLGTRPYMRARAALADCLWDMGERIEAIAHWQDMLRLCPSDNLGIRHILAPKLIALNKLRAARHLLNKYEDEALAEWGYTRALLLFLQGGPSPDASNALKAAIDNNPYVPDYLLGVKRLPKTMPLQYSLWSKEEAILYALDSGDIWKSSKGALIWLDEIVKNTL